MPEPKLQVVSIGKRFDGFAALDDVSFTLQPGSVLALLGPSGSGKSTLLKIIGGHEDPDVGDVLIDGRSVVGLPPNAIPTTTVFQQYSLFPHYDVYRNVAFGLRVRGVREPEVRSRVEQVLDLIGMHGFEGRDVSTLSGGERQRIAIARALAVEPEIFLMDEPLGALDRLIRLNMQQELARLLREVAVTTVYVTHDQHEAFVLADQIAVIHQGRIRQLGTPAQIYRQPADPFVAHFVGGTNLLSGTVREVTGERALVALASGAVWGRHHLDRPLALGEAVRVLIRPEDVGVNAPPLEGQGLTGRIVEVMYAGDVTEYGVAIDELDAIIRSKSLRTPQHRVGDRVGVRWPEEGVLVLRDAPDR